MIVKLPYGENFLNFSYSEDKFEIIKIKETRECKYKERLYESLYNPLYLPPINKFFNQKDKILIILSDATRYTASEKLIPLVIKELLKIGILKENIEFILSTGMHRLPAEEEIIKIAGKETATNFKFHIHNAYSDSKDFIDLGFTSRGTPVLINKILFNFNKILIISSIGYHYFAGFSGGRKSLIPGLASIKTIKANHKLVIKDKGFIRNPFACIARLKRNPIHLDLMEAVGKIKIPIFCIYTLVNEKKIIDVISGDIKESFRVSCLKYSEFANVDVQEPRDLVIASCGGYPKDINAIQAHKSFENASYFCKKGGIIILIAECSDGFGHRDFFHWLRYKDLKSFAKNLRNNYQVNGQTALSWKMKTYRYKVILISKLSKRYQKRLNVLIADDLNTAYNLSLSYLSPNYKGYIIPYCSEILPSIKIDANKI